MKNELKTLSVGLSKKLDRKGGKFFERRKPEKRAHRSVVGAGKISSKLLIKISKGIKTVGTVEALLVFPVATLDFAVMPGGIGADKLVADA